MRSLLAAKMEAYLHGSRSVHSEYTRCNAIAKELGAFRAMLGTAVQWPI